MEFYELQQRLGANWAHLAFLKTREDAEKHESLFNTKVEIYPTRIVKRKFTDVDEGDFI